MRIELIGNDNGDEVIGIAEIQNSNRLKQEELIQLAKSQSRDSLTVQLLNALLIVDDTHLLSAAQNAINAKHGKYMLSRSLDVEIIVFASAQRQIGKALDDLGVYDGLDEIAVVVVGSDTSLVEDTINNLIEKIGKEVTPAFTATRERIKRIKDHYQIQDKEIVAISDSEAVEAQLIALSRCVISRVSLVAFDN